MVLGGGGLKRMRYDVIVPCYWIDKRLFRKNVESWLRELLVGKIYLGVNNPEIMDYLIEFIKDYPSTFYVIDQTNRKTLGQCIMDLITLTQTSWYIFLHTDVEILPYVYEFLKHYIAPEIGIIESDRFHWDGVNTPQYDDYKLTHREYEDAKDKESEKDNNLRLPPSKQKPLKKENKELDFNKPKSKSPPDKKAR